MEQYRCPTCRRLLFEAGGDIKGKIVIACPRCKQRATFAFAPAERPERRTAFKRAGVPS